MKTVILTHSDCDGICAGAIALSRFSDAYVFFTKPVSLLNDLKDVEADRIIITDIAVNRRDKNEILEVLKEKRRKGAKILYFDHHPLPIGMETLKEVLDVFSHSLKYCASELVYNYFKDSIPKERVWIAIYGDIGDYTDTSETFKKRINDWDKHALYFEVSALIMGIKNHEFESYDAKREIVGVLAEGGNPSDVPKLVDSAKEAINREFDLYEIIKKRVKKHGKIGYIEDLKGFGFRGPSALFSATITESPIGLCIYNRKGHIDITIRKRNPDIELNKIAEDAGEAVGGSGGGHSNAAGARIPTGRLNEFLEILNKRIERYESRNRKKGS